MYKKDIINFLFVSSFPILGLGFYVQGKMSPTLGSFISIFPFVIIILFYLIDLIYRKEFEIKINKKYFLVLAFLISTALSYFISLKKGYPPLSASLTVGRVLQVFLPFHAFMVLYIYNFNSKKVIPKLTLIGLSLLLFINVFGFFVLGLSNMTHSIEGRINFPFLDSFYSGAGILCVIDLMLLYYMKQIKDDPVRFTGLLTYFLLNLVFLFYINSRLMTLIFLAVGLPFLLNRGFKSNLIYFISLFTLPILLNSTELIYDVLSHPIFEAILQRVDMRDVMTFNGRSDLWQATIDWMIDDQRGLVFGNGYMGQYFLRLVDDVALRWQVYPFNLHLHSTSLQILMSQGLVGSILIFVIFYQMFIFFRRKYQDKSEGGLFLPVIVFMLFILQVDLFVYVIGAGGVVFSLMAAWLVMGERKEKDKSALYNKETSLETVDVE